MQNLSGPRATEKVRKCGIRFLSKSIKRGTRKEISLQWGTQDSRPFKICGQLRGSGILRERLTFSANGRGRLLVRFMTPRNSRASVLPSLKRSKKSESFLFFAETQLVGHK
ncbi:unnamed protein product [Nesidiocoris tenuis]|uniref:Uncharacterized protein n=1 Tax=Nesidiocoris tenuis TaxID=355587 RepID=A0A6H5GHX1_9HEMI|nr:unnamed protein product [Nesidiocoris tenuis]